MHWIARENAGGRVTPNDQVQMEQCRLLLSFLHPCAGDITKLLFAYSHGTFLALVEQGNSSCSFRTKSGAASLP